MWKNFKQDYKGITPFFSYRWITFCCFTSIFYFVLTSFIYLRYFSGTRVRTGAGQVAKIMKSTQKSTYTAFTFTLFQNSSIFFNFILFVKCWRNFLGWNPIGSYLSLENENVTSRFFSIHHWGKDKNYVFTCLNTLIDNLIRRRIDGEIEQLKSSVHQILSDQQQEFAQAFGLQDDHSSSEVCNTDRLFIINK